MDSLGLSVIPLASFWAAFNSMVKVAEFVNSIRDSVLSGMKNNAKLSHKARRCMFFDWKLAMVGVISSSMTFELIMIWMGHYIYEYGGEISVIGCVVGITASVPLLGSVLFILCGVSYYRTMQE